MRANYVEQQATPNNATTCEENRMMEKQGMGHATPYTHTKIIQRKGNQHDPDDHPMHIQV